MHYTLHTRTCTHIHKRVRAHTQHSCVDSLTIFSIYVIHDEVKDKQFELELSWVGAGMYDHCVCVYCVL